jgi:hypothetical protein
VEFKFETIESGVRTFESMLRVTRLDGQNTFATKSAQTRSAAMSALAPLMWVDRTSIRRAGIDVNEP